MNREQRRAWRRDIKRRKLHRHPRREEPPMLAREKWQIGTIAVLERVFSERVAQMKKHGDAMRALPGGTGPDSTWLAPLGGEWILDAESIQKLLRQEYEEASEAGQLTRMHLVREELAEAFELDENDPEFIDEILQVAALCVQWAEYLLEERS
jgi:hypothetical protein